MQTSFDPLSLPELDELLRHFAFTRRVESIVLRLTPATPSIDTESTAHLRIERDGSLRPAGTWAALGDKFVIEAIASPKDQPVLTLSQQSTLIETLARLQHRFNLSIDRTQLASGPDKLVPLHAEPASQLAPLAVLERVLAGLAQRPARSSQVDPNFPFPNSARPIWVLIEKLKGVSDYATQRILEKFTQPAQYRDLASAPATSPSQARELGELTPALMNELRPHVINLAQGRFSSDGDFRTRKEDVDDIFATHLPNWAQSRPLDEPIRVVIYAHGGLVSEESGLAIAANQIDWWKDNGVYPIHFVWETGLLETIGQLINPSRQRALDLAAPTDFLLEQLARSVGGGTLWSGMKRSAELASDAQGGARYAARQLAAFCQRPEFKDRLELHAIGHSAGSIFHSHLIPAAQEENVPPFKSLLLLAPAIRVDAFHQRLTSLIGPGKPVERVTMFTMARPFELADHCANIYRKSLLYLIRASLEPERRADILGLEECLRADARLRRLFNLDGQGAAPGDIVFSVTKSTSGRAASTSNSHGGFDNDPPTMNSLARRILDRDDIKPFPEVSRAILEAGETAQRDALFQRLRPATPQPGPGLISATAIPTRVTGTSGGGGGARRALCVGINQYSISPLHGCVADAQSWATELTQLGFSTQLLLDGAATAAAIGTALSELVNGSRSGDTIVFQFAGHGTQVPDVDGDEKDGIDEALCPVDFDAGNFLIDDDLGAIFNRIPEGVNVTMFADCCHSGTVTRLAMGRPMMLQPGQKARFLVATPAIKEAHRLNRTRGTRAATAPAPLAGSPRREVLFCACRDVEVALESNGQGDFTRRAVPLLRAAFSGATNDHYVRQVIQAFGASPAQHPELHCSDELRPAAFLQAPAAAASAGSTLTGVRDEIERALAIVTQAARSGSR